MTKEKPKILTKLIDEFKSTGFETVKMYSVADVQANPDKIYIFGDNTEGWGKGGQAIIRDEPNAFGIATKDSHRDFMSDDNFEANKARIDADIAAIKADGRPIVFPEDGIGTGRADLKNKAPQTYEYLMGEIEKLKGKKIIFTNGSLAHAKNVTKRLGIERYFDDIFDIVSADFIPKPSIVTYKKIIEKYKIEPQYSIFIEDIARNLKPAHELGMKTVWIINDEPWAAEFSNSNFINYRTDKLSKFLKEINESK